MRARKYRSRAASWTLAALVVCALVGVLLGLALTAPRLPETPQQHFTRCWGWYEGTPAGREGVPCPSVWGRP